MKEFAMKHPILTFFLVDSAISGIVKIVTTIVDAFGGKQDGDGEIEVEVPVEVSVEAVEEEKPNESSGDIQ